MRFVPLLLLSLVTACSSSVVPGATFSATTTGAPPTVAATTIPPVASSTPGATAPAAIDSCGTVVNWKGDGAQMVVDIVANGATTQYNLQYQFAYPKDSAPAQAALTRSVLNTTQLVQLQGRQVAPDSGLPNTIQLREYIVKQVGACSVSARVQPRPDGFVLPPGCGYAGAPTVGTDLSAWKFDCGAGANRDARGALGYSLSQQGWTGCGVGLGSATSMKGDLRLITSEGSGVPGIDGLPTISQPARTVQTACP
jgi:hypothetical protein